MRTTDFLWTAALIGLTCGCCSEQEAEKGVPVLVASKDLKDGSILGRDDTTGLDLPYHFVTSSFVRTTDAEKITGHELRIPVAKGDPILWGSLIQPRERIGSITIRRGRALTLSIEGAGMVLPGEHVDVLFTMKDPGTQQFVTRTLLQNVIVLSSGSRTSSFPPAELDLPDPLAGKLTLMILPEEAQALVLASKLGSLHVTIRNPDDVVHLEEGNRTTVDDVLTGERIRDSYRNRVRTTPCPIRPPAGK